MPSGDTTSRSKRSSAPRQICCVMVYHSIARSARLTHAPENPHDPVLLSIENGIARLTLNRPERHNSLVPELVESLNQAIDQATRANPKVLVLDANGQSFSTGGDVQGLFDTPFDLRHGYARKLVGGLHDAILALIGMPCPTIAVVQGMVTGGSV